MSPSGQHLVTVRSPILPFAAAASSNIAAGSRVDGDVVAASTLNGHPPHRRPAALRSPEVVGLSRTSIATHLAVLPSYLTDRDRRLLELLDDHRVLTTAQIADLTGFPSQDVARQRLARLTRLEVLARFRLRGRPYHGRTPYHYVLGPAGAAVLAASRGQDPAKTRYHRAQALAVAHSQHLAHQVAVNDFFARLARHARQHPGNELVAWWSAHRCAQQWRIVRPDAYGRWREDTREVDWFLEVDRGTEPHHRLQAKLTGYAQLQAATGIPTPVLFWFTAPGRERTVHATWPTPPVPVATAVAGDQHSPAEAVWLPLGQPQGRRRLVTLRGGW